MAIRARPRKASSAFLAGSPAVPVEQLILSVRGQRVILSWDLARIYGVETRALNQAVKRNLDRFPSDFAFHLTPREALEAVRSRSQSVILKRGHNIKYAPLAFTEHGALMAANVSRQSGTSWRLRRDLPAGSVSGRPAARDYDR